MMVTSSKIVLMLLMLQLLLIKPGQTVSSFNVNQCSYDPTTFTILYDDGPQPCIEFTDGIVVEEFFGTFMDVASTGDRCDPLSSEYAYKAITRVAISTMLIVSDWRNSEPGSTATLGMAFTDQDPSLMTEL